MASLCRPGQLSRKRNTVLLMVLALVGLCTPEMLHVPVAAAGSDPASAPFRGDREFLVQRRPLPLVSWADNLVGAMIRWIIEATERTRLQIVPNEVVLHAIPGHGSYRYAVIGGQRLVVDAATHAVVYVVD